MKLNQNFSPTTTTTICTDSGHNRRANGRVFFNHRCPTCGYSVGFVMAPTLPSK